MFFILFSIIILLISVFISPYRPPSLSTRIPPMTARRRRRRSLPMPPRPSRPSPPMPRPRPSRPSRPSPPLPRARPRLLPPPRPSEHYRISAMGLGACIAFRHGHWDHICRFIVSSRDQTRTYSRPHPTDLRIVPHVRRFVQ